MARDRGQAPAFQLTFPAGQPDTSAPSLVVQAPVNEVNESSALNPPWDVLIVHGSRCPARPVHERHRGSHPDGVVDLKLRDDTGNHTANERVHM